MNNNGNYEAPIMEKIGSFEDITLGNAVIGTVLDANYSTGTPSDILTFS